MYMSYVSPFLQSGDSLSLVPTVHLLPIVKAETTKLHFYTARLIVYADHIIVSPPLCQKTVKQADETNGSFKQFDLSI